MARITVAKNKDFSVVSNAILRDKNLSMKARFLLVFMLSLADSWEYSIAGLAKAVGCGRDAITSGLQELESFGYLVRDRARDENGRLKGTDYKLYEVPQKSDKAAEKPAQEKPMQEKPAQEKPAQEKPTQINTNITNIKINKYQEEERAREETAAAVAVRMFSNNIHPLAGIIERDKLYDLIERYSADWVCAAIREAVECNARTLRYIEGVLKAWEKRGGKRDGYKGKADATAGGEQKTWDDEPDTL